MPHDLSLASFVSKTLTRKFSSHRRSQSTLKYVTFSNATYYVPFRAFVVFLLTAVFRLPNDILQVYKRLDLQALSFSDSNIPYSASLCSEAVQMIAIRHPHIYSIEDAIDTVLHLFRWVFQKTDNNESCPIPREDLYAAKHALKQWNKQSPTDIHATNNPKPPFTLLKMYQIIMEIILTVEAQCLETLHDVYLPEYKQLLAMSEDLILSGQTSRTSQSFFCFDLGIIFPLFWVAIKCREPKVRRRAVELLALMDHQEGAWKSSSAAKVASFLIDIEEEGRCPVVSMKDISETARVHLIGMKVDGKSRSILLTCLLRAQLDNISWYQREGRVTYETDFSTI